MIKPMNTQSNHIQLPQDLYQHFSSCVSESQLEVTLVDGVTKEPLSAKTQIFVYLEHSPDHKPTGRGTVEVIVAERLGHGQQRIRLIEETISQLELKDGELCLSVPLAS
jgi:hypothetical protein